MAVVTVEEETKTPVTRIEIPLRTLAFLTVLLIAAIIRFGHLGDLTLDAEEARQALAVWRFWQPTTDSFDAGAVSPAYFTLTATLFALVGDGDALARLAPALFSLLTVALPWLWRSRLGNAGALAVSALLAVSPTLNIVAASAGGEAMAVFSVLLLFIAWMRFREERRERWLTVAGGALGFGAATAPLFYSLLLTLLAAVLLHRLTTKSDGEDAVRPEEDGSIASSLSLRGPVLTALAVFVAVATFFSLRPAGLGDAAAQLALWLQQFNLAGGIRALGLPVLALARYELVVMTLGAAALLWASWRGHALPQLLVYWFAAGIVLLLLQQGAVANIFTLALPAYLLIGLWLNHALQRPAGDVRWALVLALLFLAIIAAFNGIRYLRVMSTSPQQFGFLFLTFVALASVIVAINFVRSWDAGAAYQGALIGLLIPILIFNWGTARWMVTSGGNDPRELWVESGGDDDLRMLAQLMEDISWQTTASAHRLQIMSAVDSPALRWSLRDFPNASFGETVPPGATAHAIITPVVDNALAPGDNYLGTDLGLVTTGMAATERPLSLAESLRWWVFHEHPAAITGERIILWARSDALE